MELHPTQWSVSDAWALGYTYDSTRSYENVGAMTPRPLYEVASAPREPGWRSFSRWPQAVIDRQLLHEWWHRTGALAHWSWSMRGPVQGRWSNCALRTTLQTLILRARFQRRATVDGRTDRPWSGSCGVGVDDGIRSYQSKCLLPIQRISRSPAETLRSPHIQ